MTVCLATFNLDHLGSLYDTPNSVRKTQHQFGRRAILYIYYVKLYMHASIIQTWANQQKCTTKPEVPNLKNLYLYKTNSAGVE
jgi:hypothetical protein